MLNPESLAALEEGLREGGKILIFRDRCYKGKAEIDLFSEADYNGNGCVSEEYNRHGFSRLYRLCKKNPFDDNEWGNPIKRLRLDLDYVFSIYEQLTIYRKLFGKGEVALFIPHGGSFEDAMRDALTKAVREIKECERSSGKQFRVGHDAIEHLVGVVSKDLAGRDVRRERLVDSSSKASLFSLSPHS